MPMWMKTIALQAAMFLAGWAFAWLLHPYPDGTDNATRVWRRIRRWWLA